MNDPNFGKRGRDIVTGIEGVIVGRTDWFTGCSQYGMTPKPKADAVEIPNACWFDVDRVEIIGDGVTLPAKSVPVGGPPIGPLGNGAKR